ncbi:MAG TPA: nuclear transport factor 2 family protein [Gammaproteobacteria bacterium]
MNLDQELSAIERALWTNDVEVYGRTFLPDAVIIFPEIGRIDLEFALHALRDENAAGHRWAEVNFQDVRALAPAPDVALLHYAVTARWNYKQEAEKALCATLYVKHDGAWGVAFHQQTAA